MEVKLGITGMTANKNGFGALPIQRISEDAAASLLQRAFSGGINFYDTARAYSDSERKIGLALGDKRSQLILATKTMAKTGDDLKRDLETSLKELGTDYVDLYQLHNPNPLPLPGDGSGLYEALHKAREEGMTRHIGLSNHRLDVTTQAVESGLYETVQYPFSYLSDEKDIALVELCARKNVGFIAMKALSGGIISNAAGSYAFMAGFSNVLPIWGIQRAEELDEFLSFAQNPPSLEDSAVKTQIDLDREQLSGEFCRGCGYCLPCPADIEIYMCARMNHFIRRAPSKSSFSEKTISMMKKTEDCIHCGQCATRCPYNLDPPALMEKSYREYMDALAGKSL